MSRVISRTVKELDTEEVISTETFSYDSAGNIIGGSADTTFEYDKNNKLITFNGESLTYDADGNMLCGNSMCCEYDSTNRLIMAGDHDYIYNAEGVRIRNLCTDEDTSYVYNTNCKLSQLLVKTTNNVVTKYVYGLGLIGEEVNGEFKTYHFDSRGSTIAITGENVTSIEEYNVGYINTTTYTVYSPTLVGTMYYSFDSDGKQFRKKYVAADGSEQKYVYEYRDENNVAVQLPTGVVSHSKSDHLGRKVFDELQLGKGLMNRKFTYHKGEITDAHLDNNKQVSDPETTLVKKIEFADGRTIEYEYDAEERITKVTDSVDGVYEYTYDSLGQLLTEKVNGIPVNTMTYDGYGNITLKNGISYEYDTVWKDKLTSYNEQDIEYDIEYDENGNPTNYLGTSATWEKGRQLKTFGTNTYTYNKDGIRIKKQTATEIHEYILDGANIIKETVTASSNNYTNEYFYDLDGTVCGLKHEGSAYYFYKNLQGDVIAITDDTGTTVARYTYDAWGKCTIVNDTSGINIATINPFRYRGYYYDTETGLYYLQSRYYDPEVGRFINADIVEYLFCAQEVASFNLFSYCCNKPISNCDPFGNIAIVDDITVAGIAVTAIVLLMVVRFISTREFQSAWNRFCSGLVVLLKKVWAWIRSLFMSASNIVSNSVSKSVEKAKTEIRKKRGRDYYWIASQVVFKKRGVSAATYFPCAPISYSKAIIYSKARGDIFASSQSGARKLAYASGNYMPPIGPEKHGGLGYFWHYHAYKHRSGHIFYIS